MQVRKWTTAGLISAAVVVIFTAAAWACVSGPALTLSKSTTKAGEEIGISGTGWRFKADPVTIRFNALDGPVLATAPVQAGNFSTNITAPEGTKPGNYVLIASQHAPDGSLSQQPARILLTVVGEAGATPVLAQPVGAPDLTPGPPWPEATTPSAGPHLRWSRWVWPERGCSWPAWPPWSLAAGAPPRKWRGSAGRRFLPGGRRKAGTREAGGAISG